MSEEATEAREAEAAGTPVTVEFKGETYTLRDGQPSARAMTYLARWEIDNENLAVILAAREMLGSDEWDRWCDNHSAAELADFLVAVGEANGGNS